MAYTDKCLKDPEYTYWVRSGLALNITHEVLRPLVVKEITKLHQSIVKKLPPGVSCGGCSVNPGCPNGICDKIQREIENKHWYSNPSFTNTCTGRWSTEPWEIAKCYMPPIPGYRHSSASDADFSACINVIINCKHFQAFGTSDPNIKETVYSKSRDFRNRVMHASPRKVTENDMRENLDILIDILNKIKTPETEDDTKEAIAKIQKTIQMKINIGDAIEMGKNATEASADKPEKDEDQVQRERMIANFEAGCRKALCRITEEHISKQKGNLSVAAFLSKIEILAVIKNLCSKHKEILFPEYGTHEDIGEWDLFVYCFILEELDLSEPLENAVIRFVHEVKKIRNNLLLDATGKTQDDLSELCNYLIDTDLNTEITDIFNKVSPDVDVIRSYNSLVSWWRQEEEYGNKQGKPSLSLHEETDIKTEEERTKEENQFKAMASPDKYLKDPEYINFMKSSLALCITHECLRPFVVKEMIKLHQSIVKKLPPGVSCGGCRVHTACPIGICDKIQREIENKHWYPLPSFANTSTGRWSTEPWEVAKCYMPPFKLYRCSSASDADFSACINVIINCRHFQAFGTSNPRTTETVYSKSRDFRNKSMHDTPPKVTEKDLRENLHILIDILNKIETPETKDDTKEAIAMIQKVIQMKMNIGDAKEMREIATESSADKPEKYEDQVDEMGDTNPDILLEQFPTLAGMHELDEKSMRIYLNALEKGKENLKHIRLMVVGIIGVGKTCLVRRLQNEKIEDVSSTVGIEYNVNVCEINEDDGCWTKSEGVPDSDIDGRVNDVLLNFKPDEQDPEPVKRTKSLKPVHKEKHQQLAENRDVRKQLPPKKEHNTGQFEENKEVKAINILKKKGGTGEKIRSFVNTGHFEENKEVKAISILKKKDGTGEKINRPKASGRKPTVSLWDFSGRSTYYSTHHFFLNSRSIYVLVLDISKRLDEEVNESYESFGNLQGPMKKYTCLDAFKFWVTSIYAYTQYQNMDEDIEGNQPTIILVGTFGDKLEVKDKGKDKEMQKDEYFEKALESFNEPIRKMFHKKAFLVSCTEDEDTVFDNIRAEISKIAKNQTYWSEKTPAKWLPLERFIEEKKKSKSKLMNFDDVKEADVENELKLEDKDEIKLFLKIQHFLGKVMYFDANGLDDTVILDPKWLIDMFKLFVKHRPLYDIPSELQDLWKEYKRNAKLAQPLLDYLIDHSAETKEGKENLFKENKMHVVGYMEHLDVIAKPVYPKPQVNPEATIPKEIESNKDDEFYFVPCMLKHLTAAENEKNMHGVVRQFLNLKNPETGISMPGISMPGTSTPVLCFVFDCKCLPPSIFHRLLATYIKKLQIKQQSKKYIIYNDFGAFKLDDNQTFCIWYTEFIIYARVKLHNPSYGVLYTDECIALRKELKDTLLSILLIDQQNHPQKRYVKGAFTEYIKCEHLFKRYPPTSPQSHDAMDGLHEVRKIEQNELKTVNCSCSMYGKREHSISSVEALEYWYKEPKHLEQISAWFKRKERDHQGFLSEKPHSDDDFSELDKYLPAEGEEFDKLGTLLDVARNTIKELSKSGAVELIKKWTKQDNDENTWGLLKEKLYILKEEINRHH